MKTDSIPTAPSVDPLQQIASALTRIADAAERLVDQRERKGSGRRRKGPDEWPEIHFNFGRPESLAALAEKLDQFMDEREKPAPPP